MGTEATGPVGLGISLSLLFLSSCAGAAAPEPAKTAPLQAGIAGYLPLEDATVFSYDTSLEPSGEHGLLVLEVRRPRPEVAEFVVAGKVSRMNVTPSAVAHVTGGFLLREPLAVGENWQGDFGHVRVTSVERKIAVPAGAFEACVETVEEMSTDAGKKRTTTVFCPRIGITVRETEALQDGERAVQRIALRSYGKRF